MKSVIEETFYKYLLIQSVTKTKSESKVDEFLTSYFEDIEYFKNNPNNFGLLPLNDNLNRNVNWAFLKGEGSKTIVLIHHYDVVHVNNYYAHKQFAFEPNKLHTSLLTNQDILEDEAIADLKSNEWIFGRGSADMKGGGSIQLSLLKKWSSELHFKGNVVLLAVPDEENISSGMRKAIELLVKLKNNYNLKYNLMINSEPHQRITYDKGVTCTGSIAKANYFVYVKGALTHSGKVLEGVNPVAILSRIITATELSKDFVDYSKSQTGIPPTWINMETYKESYDISTCEKAIGYFNVLDFYTSPKETITKLTSVINNSLSDYFNHYYDVCSSYSSDYFPKWKFKTLTYSQLIQRLKDEGKYQQFKTIENSIILQLQAETIDFMQATKTLVDKSVSLLSTNEVLVVVGLCIPYYPGVSNDEFNTAMLCDIVQEYTKKELNIEYENKPFFTGISDLSYSYIKDSKSLESSLNNMPFYNSYYSIPVNLIKEVTMPCINIGPWGKDFHKVSERVYKKDLFYDTPKLIDYVVKTILK